MTTPKARPKRRNEKPLKFEEIEPYLRKLAATARSKELRIISKVLRALWMLETTD